MDAFGLQDLAETLERTKQAYQEFLRVPSLSLGIYRLPAGAKDLQEPHTEDEAYYVARGRGSIRVGSEDLRVGPGSIVFVNAGVGHRFHDIVENLVILVFFAPAEGTKAIDRA